MAERVSSTWYNAGVYFDLTGARGAVGLQTLLKSSWLMKLGVRAWEADKGFT